MSAPPTNVGRSERAAFLAGEGTLTAQEVREWAAELAPERGLPPMPSGMPPTEPLMVAVVPPPPDGFEIERIGRMIRYRAVSALRREGSA